MWSKFTFLLSYPVIPRILSWHLNNTSAHVKSISINSGMMNSQSSLRIIWFAALCEDITLRYIIQIVSFDRPGTDNFVIGGYTRSQTAWRRSRVVERLEIAHYIDSCYYQTLLSQAWRFMTLRYPVIPRCHTSSFLLRFTQSFLPW